MNTPCNNAVRNDENTRLDNLQERFSQLEQRYAQTEARSRNDRRRFRVQMGLALAAVTGAILLSPANRAAIAQTTQLTLASLDARLKVVEGRTQYQSVDAGGNTLFTGTNVYVQSGSGSTTGFINGKGNLIIGYNGIRNDGTDLRVGSHNLIVGDMHNYTSYGGIVFGLRNESYGPYSSVSGGYGNFAGGWYSSISGGLYNKVTGPYSSVSGGEYNTTIGYCSSVSGGYKNTASSYFSSVSGGTLNTASGTSATISGGYGHAAANTNNWAAGSLFQGQ